MIWFINYRLNIQELQCNIILYYLPAGAVDFFYSAATVYIVIDQREEEDEAYPQCSATTSSYCKFSEIRTTLRF